MTPGLVHAIVMHFEAGGLELELGLLAAAATSGLPRKTQ
jgi:hypothetical protein